MSFHTLTIPLSHFMKGSRKAGISWRVAVTKQTGCCHRVRCSGRGDIHKSELLINLNIPKRKERVDILTEKLLTSSESLQSLHCGGRRISHKPKERSVIRGALQHVTNHFQLVLVR